MKRRFLIFILMIIVVSLTACSSITETTITTTNLITTTNTTQNISTYQLSEEELVAQNSFFQNALPMDETFTINDIDATIDRAVTNLAYIGNNINTGMMGVYIYVDYDQSDELMSEWFKVIDVYGNVYSHITADGLDTLCSYRNHHEISQGYYRVSLPNDLFHYLFRYGDESNYTYIHFIVEEGY